MDFKQQKTLEREVYNSQETYQGQNSLRSLRLCRAEKEVKLDMVEAGCLSLKRIYKASRFPQYLSTGELLSYLPHYPI